MSIPRRQIETALGAKGFVRRNNKHRYFHHVYRGKQTGIVTFTSHGPSYKVYDDSLLGAMKRQLGLDTMRQVRDLLLCPISGDEYVRILREKGVIRE